MKGCVVGNRNFMTHARSRKEVVVRGLLRGFRPMWFVTTMGTGISSLVLYNFPWQAHWLKYCSYVMFGICCVLFVFLSIICAASCFVYPEKIRQMFLSVQEAPFWGCFSMGFSSIVAYLHLITGKSWVTALFVFWIINITVSIGTSAGLTFLLHLQAEIKPERIHLALLLPVVSQNVVATVGGTIYTTIHPNLRLFTIIAALLCWGNGMALTAWICGVYFWKLYVHKIERGPNNGFSAFIPIGAFGQGAYGILLLTDAFRDYVVVKDPWFLSYSKSSEALPDNSLIVGEISRYLGLFIAIFLVSNGFYFTLNAIFTVIATGSNGYSSLWWASTFPLGTMALSTGELYRMFGFGAFRIVSAIYGVILILMTITCLLGSAVYDFPHEIYMPRRKNVELKPDPIASEAGNSTITNLKSSSVV